MIFIRNKASGFSLVETLVAISILLIVVVGPMTIASNASRGSSFSSEQVVAFFLAQEGAELVQKGRDDFLLPFMSSPGVDDEGWDDVLGAPSGSFSSCSSGGLCNPYIDPALGIRHSGGCESDPEMCRLYIDDQTTGARARYTHDDAGGSHPPSIYRREISMEPGASSDEMRVISTVWWQADNQFEEQSVSVETYLFNVYGR